MNDDSAINYIVSTTLLKKYLVLTTHRIVVSYTYSTITIISTCTRTVLCTRTLLVPTRTLLSHALATPRQHPRLYNQRSHAYMSCFIHLRSLPLRSSLLLSTPRPRGLGPTTSTILQLATRLLSELSALLRFFILH